MLSTIRIAICHPVTPLTVAFTKHGNEVVRTSRPLAVIATKAGHGVMHFTAGEPDGTHKAEPIWQGALNWRKKDGMSREKGQRNPNTKVGSRRMAHASKAWQDSWNRAKKSTHCSSRRQELVLRWNEDKECEAENATFSSHLLSCRAWPQDGSLHIITGKCAQR